MMARKYITRSVNALANAESGSKFSTDYDDYERHVVGVYCSDHTAGVFTRVYRHGQMMAEISDDAFSSAYGYYALDETYKVQEQFELRINNTTVGAINPVVVGLIYEVKE